jgi:hypothetical protein
VSGISKQSSSFSSSSASQCVIGWIIWVGFECSSKATNIDVDPDKTHQHWFPRVFT